MIKKWGYGGQSLSIESPRKAADIDSLHNTRTYSIALLEGKFVNLYWHILIGYGGLSLSIEGPSKADIECHDNEDGTCRVTYKPTEPGTYIINIKFADEHVPGTVFPSDFFLTLVQLPAWKGTLKWP